MFSRHSSNRPTQSLNVPIFAIFPGMNYPEYQVQSSKCEVIFFALGTLHFELLFCCERGGPLLDVSVQAFLRVLAVEKDGLQFAFNCERRLHRQFPAGLDGALDMSD